MSMRAPRLIEISKSDGRVQSGCTYVIEHHPVTTEPPIIHEIRNLVLRIRPVCTSRVLRSVPFASPTLRRALKAFNKGVGRPNGNTVGAPTVFLSVRLRRLLYAPAIEPRGGPGLRCPSCTSAQESTRIRG
jgi:hypothetical protein